MRLIAAIAALLAGLLAVVAGVLMAAQRQAPPAQNAWLVMARSETSVNNNARDVSIVRLMVGSEVVQPLVRDVGMVYRITFSPDGETMAFDTSNPNPTMLQNPGGGPPRQDFYHQIYLKPMGPDAPTLLELDVADAYAPAWSPDGEWIAFIGGETRILIGADGLPYYDDQYFVYKVRPDGSDLTRIAETIGNGRVQWSPDSQRLVFPAAQAVPNLPPSSDVYIVNADGTGLRRLTYDPANDLSPFFSPDGEHIVFLSDRGKSTFGFDVWWMNDDGTLPDRLYETYGSSGAVAWSPNGRAVASVQDYIMLESLPLPRYNIQLTDMDSGETRRVSPIDANYWAPAWSPPAKVSWQGWPPVVAGVVLLLAGLAAVRWRSGIPESINPRFYRPHAAATGSDGAE